MRFELTNLACSPASVLGKEPSKKGCSFVHGSELCEYCVPDEQTKSLPVVLFFHFLIHAYSTANVHVEVFNYVRCMVYDFVLLKIVVPLNMR